MRQPKVVLRTKEAAQELASHLGTARIVHESGNAPDGWIFAFIHKGEEYHVEVCAGVIHDDEQEELDRY